MTGCSLDLDRNGPPKLAQPNSLSFTVCSGASLEDGDTHILTAHGSQLQVFALSWLYLFFLNNYVIDNLTESR